MKVLILNGSPRRNGSTASILKAVYAGASVTHEVEWVDVNQIDLPSTVAKGQIPQHVLARAKWLGKRL